MINQDGSRVENVNYIEQQGGLPLKIVNGVYTIETPDGDLAMRRANGSEYLESSRYAFTAVEPKAEGDGYVAILTFDDGQVSIRQFDTEMHLEDFTAPQDVADVVDQESELNIDIDGDGVIGTGDDYSPDGRATNGSIEINQSLSGSLETMGDRDWFAIDLSAGTQINIDLTGDFDTVLELQDSNGNIVAFDDDGGSGLNSRLSFVAPGSDTYYVIAGAYADEIVGSYQLSLNDANYVEQSGDVFLKTIDGAFTIETPDGDITMRRANGNEYIENNRYAFTAVEPQADGNGYVAILTFDDGRVSIRQFDSEGYLQDFTAPQDVADVVDQEVELNIDIDGDGEIGGEFEIIEESGSTFLFTIDGTYAISTYEEELIVLRRGDGSAYTESSRYAFTAVEPQRDGDGYVAILTFDDGQVSIRQFDGEGYLQNFTAPQDVADVVDQEEQLNIDIDGDGAVGGEFEIIEESGSTLFLTIDGTYAISTYEGEFIVLRRANGSEYLESSRYAFTAVEPQRDGDGYVAILTFDDGQVSIRQFDSEGYLQDFTAPQDVADVVDQEVELNIDIDGDGAIADITYVEQQGSVDLKTVNGVYTIETPNGDDLVMRRANGSEYVESSRYAFTAVEPQSDDDGYMAILTFDDGQVSIRQFDADMHLQDFTAPQDVADVVDREVELNIDINGDGALGLVAGVSETAAYDGLIA